MIDQLKAGVAFIGYTVAILAVVIVPHWIAYAAVPAPEPRVGGALTITLCPTEDSTGCYWDASEQGNGQGEDLWN